MTNEERLYRVIDANLNRLKEGLRVVEDVRRYGFDDLALAKKIKTLRHKAKIPQKEFIKFRDAANDVLKPSLNLDDLQTANIKRAQESARVLEECFKLIDVKISEIFKTVRYELYEIEKEI